MAASSLVFHVAIFAHIVGILLLAGALLLQAALTGLLRQSDTLEKLHLATGLARKVSPLFGVASALILLSGAYLSWRHISGGGSAGWLIVAIVSYVAMGVYGSMTGQNFQRHMTAAMHHSKGKMTKDLRQLTMDNHQLDHVLVGAAMFTGILILMIFKPGIIISIALIIICLGVGLLACKYMRLTTWPTKLRS